MSDLPDDDLVPQLRRVRSDLSFRSRVRLGGWLILVFVVVDLFTTAGVVVALLGLQHVQHEACQRDNVLRAAYVAQWQPILDIPPTPLAKDATEEQRRAFEAQQNIRVRFVASLVDGFAQHAC